MSREDYAKWKRECYYTEKGILNKMVPWGHLLPGPEKEAALDYWGEGYVEDV